MNRKAQMKEVLTRNGMVEVHIRSINGNDFELWVKPETKLSSMKKEIWEKIGVKTQINIGIDIVDFLEEYVESTELSYAKFTSLTPTEQVKTLAKNGKFIELFWRHYMLIFDGLIIEEEATIAGIGLVSGDAISVLPRVLVGTRENLYLTLFLGVRREAPEVKIGINNQLGGDYGLPVVSPDGSYHDHQHEQEKSECLYHLKLVQLILLPTLNKMLVGTPEELPEKLPNFSKVKIGLQIDQYPHAIDALWEVHDLVRRYSTGIIILEGLGTKEELEFQKWEAGKTKAMYEGVLDITRKFEGSIYEAGYIESLGPDMVYVGPCRSFSQFNHTMARPGMRISGVNKRTTIGDLIQSYKHYIRGEGNDEPLELTHLIYDGKSHDPGELIVDIIMEKLYKHYFYFYQNNLVKDGRDINDLLDYIEGPQVDNSSPVRTGKTKKKNKKNRSTSNAANFSNRKKSGSNVSEAASSPQSDRQKSDSPPSDRQKSNSPPSERQSSDTPPSDSLTDNQQTHSWDAHLSNQSTVDILTLSEVNLELPVSVEDALDFFGTTQNSIDEDIDPDNALINLSSAIIVKDKKKEMEEIQDNELEQEDMRRIWKEYSTNENEQLEENSELEEEEDRFISEEEDRFMSDEDVTEDEYCEEDCIEDVQDDLEPDQEESKQVYFQEEAGKSLFESFIKTKDIEEREEDTEEMGAASLSFQHARYLDRLSEVISAKAKAEWEKKKKIFESLQKERENIQLDIEEKDKTLIAHRGKVEEMIEMKSKEMSRFIGLISKEEDEKYQTHKEMEKLDQEVEELHNKIRIIHQENDRLKDKCVQNDQQIEKFQKKQLKLEKYIEEEMINSKEEGEKIKEEMLMLKDKLADNIKRSEDLANIEIVPRNEPIPVAVQQPPPINQTRHLKMVEFLDKSIKEKEADLECPVCFEVAQPPIFMCQEMHLICADCRPKVHECPECRVAYKGPHRRHRYAEKTAEEVNNLKEQRAELLEN